MATLLVTIKGVGMVPIINKNAPVVSKTPISEEDYNILKSMGWDIKVHSSSNPRVSIDKLNGTPAPVKAQVEEHSSENEKVEEKLSSDDASEPKATPEGADEVTAPAVDEEATAPVIEAEEEEVTLPEGITLDEQNGVYRDSEGRAVELDENYNIVSYIDETPAEEAVATKPASNRKKNK